MKKLKLFLGVALFGAMSFGAFSAYDYMTMSEEERVLLENVEALTEDEVPGVNKSCHKTGSDEAIGCYANNTGAHCRKHEHCSPK